jgi:hypothetical protein
MINDRIKYTTYLAGYIESSPKNADNWRNIVYESLKNKDLLIYCPVRQEAAKTGKITASNCEYIKGLKQGGHFEKFYEAMWKIWFGVIEPNNNTELIEVFRAMRTRKFIDGNRERDLEFFGDFEAVIRSDFIVAYLPKDILTVGTHWEMFVAALFKIPVYLILPDHSKTDANSTMIFGNMLSGGQIFYTVNETIKFIKEKYILTEEKK